MICPVVFKHSTGSVLPKFRAKCHYSFPHYLSITATSKSRLFYPLAQIWSISRDSSGLTTFLLSAFARVTQSGHCCALIDAGDSFDPISAESAGVILDCVLWVRCREKVKHKPSQDSKQLFFSRQPSIASDHLLSSNSHISATVVLSMGKGVCSSAWQLSGSGQQISAPRGRVLGDNGKHFNRHNQHKIISCSQSATNSKNKRLSPLEKAFKAADILVQNGGFGLIVVDLRNIETTKVRKVPLTTWFRFARIAEKTQTALLFLTNVPAPQSCAGLTVHMGVDSTSRLNNGALWSEEKGVREAVDEATSKAIVYEAGQFSRASTDRVLGGLSKGMSVNKEVAAERSKASGTGRRRFIASHIQTLKGAEYEINIKRGRKPAQSSAAKFQTMSNWK